MTGATIEKIRLGVVVERRTASNPWQDHLWRPVEVLPGGPEAPKWRVLGEGPGWIRFYTGLLPLELFRKETEGYKRNLASETPVVYVVLRADGDGRMAPFHVTACPYEAAAYQISGDEVVEGVPMPAAVGVLVEDFVARWHVDEPFVKRKQKPKVEGRS